jgi:hypothetical protein
LKSLRSTAIGSRSVVDLEPGTDAQLSKHARMNVLEESIGSAATF